MASLQKRSSGLYLISFRFQGRQYQRSLETDDATSAKLIKENVEHRLKHIFDGVLRLPDGAAPDDLWAVLLHGRVPESPAKLITPIPLRAAADEYLKSYPTGSKEPATLKTERVHLNNFERILGGGTALHTIACGDIQRYITKRLASKGNRGGTVKADTVRKELQTFQLVWKLAKQTGHVAADCPVAEVRRPKRRQKPPFQTWEQILSAINRGQQTEEQAAELWDGLFLREAEVAEFLAHVKSASQSLARFAYIHPAISFCAYTGARRSEMFRARFEDVADGWITVREKKRDRDTKLSYRMVPLNPELAIVLDAWIERHPGGPFLFCKSHGQPLEDRTSREAFDAVTKNSKWSELRGYHVLRHSFASNLARSGSVSQAAIDDLMGHQTEEMRRRYRHLFPEDKRRAVDCLSYTTVKSA
jgi:integrase